MADDPLAPVDIDNPEFAEVCDELPLWSARFGLLLLEHVPLRSGMTIVDVGAGTGFLSAELAQRCGADATVYAVDPWAPALRRLQRRLDHIGVPNVTTVPDAIEDADLPEGIADLAVSNLGINNFADPLRSLIACRRLLKPGGTLALTTNLSGHMHEFYDVFAEGLTAAGLADRLDALAEHVAHRGTVESVGSLLAAAGFEVGATVTESFRMRFATGAAVLRHWLVRVGFLPAWRAVVPEHALHDVFSDIERRLDRIAAEHGEIALTIPMLYIEGHVAG